MLVNITGQYVRVVMLGHFCEDYKKLKFPIHKCESPEGGDTLFYQIPNLCATSPLWGSKLIHAQLCQDLNNNFQNVDKNHPKH